MHMQKNAHQLQMHQAPNLKEVLLRNDYSAIESPAVHVHNRV